ncbi:hypothetical protein C8J57DRAFT_1495447 [Mycena rebaudengoi]|nr:hypothetical protein C8J57DRAFT_1495447 [Mycena rebaudengoi]
MQEDTEGFSPVNFERTVFINNNCKEPKTFVGTTTDGDGNVKPFTTDSETFLTFPIGTALPITVSISTEQTPADVTTVIFHDVQYLTYKLGTGAAPPDVIASILTQVFWCFVE